MSANDNKYDEPDLSHYEENRSKFSLDELDKYGGKFVAFSADGTRIVASGDSWEALDAALEAVGIHVSQVVSAYLDPPGVSHI